MSNKREKVIDDFYDQSGKLIGLILQDIRERDLKKFGVLMTTVFKPSSLPLPRHKSVITRDNED
jgi:hypothetical protein